MADKKSGWQLDDAAATYARGDLSVTIDILQPAEGLLKLHYAGSEVTCLKSLMISPEPPAPKGGETVIEAYARGDDDLIVSYAQTPARTSRPVIEWSAVHEAEVVGLQSTIAMLTSLLDCDPTVRIRSRFGAGKLLQAGAESPDRPRELVAGDSIEANATSVFVFRPDDADWSYAEILFPSDFQGAEIAKADGGLEIEFSLFPEFLEKGVIRKGRIQALFMPRADDLAHALAAHERLANSPAPLTT